MPEIAPTKYNTCAVIITYFPDANFHERLALVLAQFSRVIVVDNGSGSELTRTLQQERPSSHLDLVANISNLGIAAALNQGVQLASQLGFEWVVTLDQDTILHDGMLQNLINTYEKSGGGKILAGSNYWNARKNRNFLDIKNPESVFCERKTVITSGTLTALRLFKEIGFFREDYFIDSVDHEICLRARKHGWRILLTCKPCMSHSIGVEMDNAGWLRKRLSFNHSPTRKYFIARNTIATIKLYLLQEPAWCLRQVFRLCADILSIAAFEDQKAEKTYAFLLGTLHGIRGKLGPLEKAWPRGFQ